MVTDSTSLGLVLGLPLDDGVTTASDCPTSPAPIDTEPPTESAPDNTETPLQTVLDHKEPITEAYYYQKLRESADRFAYQLSTSKYVDDVELTWRGFDDKKKELVITSAMRFISFDPEADFQRFDDLAMAAMTSVMLNIVRTNKKSMKKPVGNSLLRRAVIQAAEQR